MTHRVREALLSHPVQDELLVVAERWKVPRERPVDAHVRALGEPLDEVRERGDEPQRVERVRAKLPREAADLLDALPHVVAQTDQLGAQLGGRGRRHAVDLQDDRGQMLAELVVQLGGEAPPLGLSLGERAASAVASLGLEAIEHRVEALREDGDLRLGARVRKSLAGTQRIDALHERREADQGRERAAHEDEVHGEHDRQPPDEHQDPAVGRAHDEDHGSLPRARSQFGMNNRQKSGR